MASRLTAVLNSKLAYYAAFMRSPAFGWDRHIFEMSDWLATPVPSSIITNDERWQEVEVHERWLRQHRRSDASASLTEAITDTEEAMNRAIFDVYELADQEAVLIDDAIQFTISPFRTRRQGGKPALAAYAMPERSQLQAYASYMLKQLNGVLQYQGSGLDASVFVSDRAPIIACRFVTSKGERSAVVNEVNVGGIEQFLQQISQHLRSQVADHLFVQRDLRVYDDEAFWTFKPAEARHWTRTAALQDADAVIREHMEMPVGSALL